MPGSRSRWERRNPRAARKDLHRAMSIARIMARTFAREGASAVVLAGSWARGDAHRWSDLDLWVVGRREGTEVLFRGGLQVSVHRTTVRKERSRFDDPKNAWGAVPGWREAVLLHDPSGVAGRLKGQAERFRPERLRRSSSRYLGRELTGWAEEVQKLTRSMAEGDHETAAVQRNLLGNAMAALVAVHLEMPYGTENALWERVGARMSPGWRRAQRRALGVEATSFDQSCEAALELYALTAGGLWAHLIPLERRLVKSTCRACGHPLPSFVPRTRARLAEPARDLK